MTSEPDFPALPVVFDPKILVQNPMFAELLQQLETKLTPTGVSLDVENAYQTARLNLEREKGPYVHNLLLYSELKELIWSWKLDQANPLYEKQQRIFSTLNRMIIVGETLQRLSLTPSAEAETLMGLTPEDLRSTISREEVDLVRSSTIDRFGLTSSSRR